MKKVPATICLKTPASGRGRVACGDRQMVAGTFFSGPALLPQEPQPGEHAESDDEVER